MPKETPGALLRLGRTRSGMMRTLGLLAGKDPMGHSSRCGGGVDEKLAPGGALDP